MTPGRGEVRRVSLPAAKLGKGRRGVGSTVGKEGKAMIEVCENNIRVFATLFNETILIIAF